MWGRLRQLSFWLVFCAVTGSLQACTEHTSEKHSGPGKAANMISPSELPTAPRRSLPKRIRTGTRLLKTPLGSIFAVPYSDPSDNSPLLGKLTAIERRFGDTTETLLKHCLNAVVTPAAKGPFVAIECVSGQAAMTLMHSVFVLSLSDGKTLASQNLCRTAVWRNGQLSCAKEEVDANGDLHLSITRIFPTPVVK